MARAQGARAQMALAFETVYGTAPASGFTKMPFARTMLGAEQPLLGSALLDYGRDPLAPIKDASEIRAGRRHQMKRQTPRPRRITRPRSRIHAISERRGFAAVS